MENHFIKTDDEHTANLLRQSGLHELAKEGSKWVFIAEQDKIDFSSSDLKMFYTNKLCF